MEIAYYFCLAVVVLLLVAIFLFKKSKGGEEKKKIPETYFGAIRVTDREGRDMLIVRKGDGSFDMVEEEKVKK
ncbi:MAG: hypothetical protein ABFD97_24815 [Syntrophobacter sp.]